MVLAARLDLEGVDAETCGRHRSARAGWRCTGCKARLCGGCTAVKGAGAARLTICTVCGGMAQPLTIHRAEVRSFASRLVEVPRFPIQRAALTSLFALAAILALFDWLLSLPWASMGKILVWLTRLGMFWAYFFYLIRMTASGSPHIGAPDFRDKDDLFGPALRGMVGTMLVWAPPIVYITATSDLGVMPLLAPWILFEELIDAITAFDPILWACIAFGVAYGPIALLAAATDIGVLGMLNPVLMFSFVARLGRDYWIAVGALVLAGALSWAADALVVPVVGRLPIPGVGRWLATAISLYFPFVMARILGLLLHVRGDRIDWGQASEYQELVLKGVEPHGRLAAPDAPKRRDDAPGPLDLSPEPPAAPRKAAPSVEPAPDGAFLFGTPAEQIAAALDAGDPARAIAIYAAAPTPESLGLRLDQHYAVGCAAAKASNFPLAITALKLPAESDDPFAGAAMVALAQVYGFAFGDRDLAAGLYRKTIERYPGTEVAAYAQKKLEALA